MSYNCAQAKRMSQAPVQKTDASRLSPNYNNHQYAREIITEDSPRLGGQQRRRSLWLLQSRGGVLICTCDRKCARLFVLCARLVTPTLCEAGQ